jgi:hypothetical protein
LLTSAHGQLTDRSVLVTCEGELKALYLKAQTHPTIGVDGYALKGLQAMKFNPAKDSDRPMISQTQTGGDLLLGWLRPRNPLREDWLRKADRDQLFLAMRLVPLLRACEDAMEKYLTVYWEYHLSQAARLVRPLDEQFKTLDKVSDLFQRDQLKTWDATNYYHFLGTRAFSTVTLNHNILFGVHQDGRNVLGTLSCLTALGEYTGGELCFPRLGVTFNLRPGDLLIADTNNEFHGTVGGIVGSRYSVVAYLHKSLLPKD